MRVSLQRHCWPVPSCRGPEESVLGAPIRFPTVCLPGVLASPDQTYGFRGEKGKSANRVRANSAKEPEASTRRRTMVVKFGEQR